MSGNVRKKNFIYYYYYFKIGEQYDGNIGGQYDFILVRVILLHTWEKCSLAWFLNFPYSTLHSSFSIKSNSRS